MCEIIEIKAHYSQFIIRHHLSFQLPTNIKQGQAGVTLFAKRELITKSSPEFEPIHHPSNHLKFKNTKYLSLESLVNGQFERKILIEHRTSSMITSSLTVHTNTIRN